MSFIWWKSCDGPILHRSGWIFQSDNKSRFYWLREERKKIKGKTKSEFFVLIVHKTSSKSSKKHWLYWEFTHFTSLWSNLNFTWKQWIFHRIFQASSSNHLQEIIGIRNGAKFSSYDRKWPENTNQNNDDHKLFTIWAKYCGNIVFDHENPYSHWVRWR